MHSDSVADCFTRIRNGAKAHLETVDMPHSNLNENLLNLLKKQGFLSQVEVIELGDKKKNLRARLKFGRGNIATLDSIKRISKPGQRVYSKVPTPGKVRGGLGFQIISTSKGIMTDQQAHDLKIGGEIIGEVY